MNRLLNLLLLSVLLGAALPVFAQGNSNYNGSGNGNSNSEGPKEPDDGFYKRQLRQMAEPHDTKRRSPLDVYVMGQELKESRTRAQSSIWMGWQANINDKQGTNEEDEEEAGEKNENGYAFGQPQHYYHNTNPPLQGHMMGMQGKAWAKSVEYDMKGELTKKMIALAQTEPGVHAGVASAENIGGWRLNAVYQAQQSFINQLPDSEWAKQKIMATMNACIAFQQKEKGKKGGGWLEAVSLCIGDSSEEAKSNKFDEVKADKDLIEPGMHPSQDTEHEKTADDIVKEAFTGADAGNENALSVADELFNQDAKTGKRKKLVSLAKAWATWFGDYELIFVDKKKGSKDNKIGNAYSRRVFQEHRVPPLRTVASLAYGITLARFTDMRDLMKAYCDKLAEIEEKAKSSTEPSALEQADKDNFFNENMSQDNKKKVWQLSTPERPLQASVMNAILGSYIYRVKQGAKQGESLKEICEAFTTKVKEIKEQDPIFDTYSQMYDYAKYAAVSQILRTFEEAERFVDRRSAGPGAVDASIADRARRMIYEIAQVSDLYQAIEYNLKEWDGFIAENIFKRRAEEIGREGAGVTKAVVDPNAGSR